MPIPSESPAPTAQTSPTGTPSATPAETEDPLTARTEAQITVAGGPDLPIAAFGSLWLLTPDSDEPGITRLDPATNEIVAALPIGSQLCQAIGATEDAIWACTRGGVARVDPETNEVTARVEFPTAEVFGYLPYGHGSLWALSGEVAQTTELVRIDPQVNRVVGTYPLGFDASWISYGEGALWVSDTTGGALWRFDPETEALSEHSSGLTEPGPSAVGAGSVWLAVHAGAESTPTPPDVTLVRIDPASGEVEAEYSTGGTIFGGLIYAAEEAVWIRAVTPFLSHVDPATDEITETIEADRAGGSVTVAYGSLWATSYNFNTVWRLTP